MKKRNGKWDFLLKKMLVNGIKPLNHMTFMSIQN